ncbi:MAG: DinB family protein [Candidatus Eisenbacteria bacterium]|jgi:hypothetical protein|nr:DinB family protein [Candidatus Eisenbacteria bacterium]MBP8136851.1 DinB family protein [Candidatus Eisenbacteria bacterium]
MAARRGAKKKASGKAEQKRATARTASRASGHAPAKAARKKAVVTRKTAAPSKKKLTSKQTAKAAKAAKPARKKAAVPTKTVVSKKAIKSPVAPKAPVAKKPAVAAAPKAAVAVAPKPAAAKPARITRMRQPYRDTRPPQREPEFQPAFEQQRTGANPKEILLFEMQRARVAVMASIQGMTAPVADRPTAPGKWSVREIVLHLIVRDRVRLDEFAPVLGGRAPSWTGLDEGAMARVNELHLGPLRPLSWEEAVRLLQATREQLVAALVSVPSHPAELWTEAHPFGAMLHALPRHDRHHAEQIKSARIEG